MIGQPVLEQVDAVHSRPVDATPMDSHTGHECRDLRGTLRDPSFAKSSRLSAPRTHYKPHPETTHLMYG